MRRKTRDELMVLKLGGSVITRKELPMTPDMDTIERLAEEIAQANVERLVIVHGGGSFGHPLAKQHRIKEGYKDQSQIVGFLKTQQAMRQLNKLVVNALVHHDIAAYSVAPSSFLVTEAGRIKGLSNAALTMALRMGFVPVLFGDAVIDSREGFNILSGDQLVAVLATEFKADRIIFGVDVDGLHTADPKTDASAHLIPLITLQDLDDATNRIEGAKVTDVTGGMLGKVSELRPAVALGIQAVVVNASKERNIYKALMKEEVVGTLIEKE